MNKKEYKCVAQSIRKMSLDDFCRWCETQSKIMSDKISFGFQKFMLICLHCCCQICFWFQKMCLLPIKIFLNQTVKLEPTETCWSNIYQLSYTFENNVDVDSYKYNSSNNYHVVVNEDISFLSRDYIYFLDYIQTEQTPVLLESLFIAKFKNQYIFRSVFVKDKGDEKDDDYEKPIPYHVLEEKLIDFPPRSNVEFILVEYKHPFMINEVELKIPKEYYLVRNELFSPAFVLRMLEQQPEYFIFDMDYTLSIMDHQIKRILLHADQYIVMNESDYVIKYVHEETIFPVLEEPEPEESEKEGSESDTEDDMYSGIPTFGFFSFFGDYTF